MTKLSGIMAIIGEIEPKPGTGIPPLSGSWGKNTVGVGKIFCPFYHVAAFLNVPEIDRDQNCLEH